MRQWTKEVGGVTSTGKSRVLIDRISQSIIIIVSQLKEGLFDPKIQGGCRSMQRRLWKLDRTRKKRDRTDRESIMGTRTVLWIISFPKARRCWSMLIKVHPSGDDSTRVTWYHLTCPAAKRSNRRTSTLRHCLVRSTWLTLLPAFDTSPMDTDG
mgnify:CR=1 FL=1